MSVSSLSYASNSLSWITSSSLSVDFSSFGFTSACLVSLVLASSCFWVTLSSSGLFAFSGVFVEVSEVSSDFST